jgi:hypothetical protein
MLYHPNPKTTSVSEILGLPVHQSVCFRKKYNEAQLSQHLLGWYKAKREMSVRAYHKLHTTVNRTTCERHFEKSGLKALHEKGGLLEEAKDVLETWMKVGKGSVKKDTLDALHQSNMFFRESEQKMLVELCKMMHFCGQALSQDELLDIMNEMLLEKHSNVGADDEFVPATLKVVRCFLQRQEGLEDKVHAAASIDPLRAAQANSKTRESMFVKLNNFIELLHEMGLISETCYADFEDSQKFNMDEVALNTTKARKKVISAIGKSRLFQETVEGDGRMPRHMTIALTTCANGEFI